MKASNFENYLPKRHLAVEAATRPIAGCPLDRSNSAPRRTRKQGKNARIRPNAPIPMRKETPRAARIQGRKDKALLLDKTAQYDAPNRTCRS